MKSGSLLCVVFVGSLLLPIYCPTSAQTSWKAEHCRLLATSSGSAGPKVIVDDLVLDRPTDVTEEVWNAVVSETKARIFLGDGWVDDLREVSLKGALQNQGYLKADVSADARIISSSPVLEHVVVHAGVRGGPRYSLSGVQFRNIDSEKPLAFSTEELSTLVSLHEGDLFSPEKIRTGITALRKWYSSHGYIDFVASPDTEIDEMRQQIALVMSLQEGTQFRLGNIEIVGLDSVLESELRSKMRPGDVLNFQLIVDLYQEHKSELPEEALPGDTEFHTNMKERIADASFDFRSCAQLQQ
ncbi:MAG TPA: POTRA domain-containing protein [Candidatus Acidoferrum sp.]|nr:POTRA domain-containing protein [Candidatus Acidoferrum sp.]